MTLRDIYSPAHGRTVRLGRKRPPAGARKLAFGRYLDLTKLPPVPPSADYTGAAGPILADILGNDRVGDCTCAGACHVQGVVSGNAGAPLATNTSQALALYSAITGYNPNDPSTDQGANEVDVLNYLQQSGFPNGEKLAGWVTVDATNRSEVQAALYVLENLYHGLELPDAYVQSMPSGNGFRWDVAGDPDPQNGHCIIGAGYTTDGIVIDTWGLLGTLTWGALAKYCVPLAGGELYALLLQSEVSRLSNKSPQGFAWSDLLADFQALGGTVQG